MIRHQGRIQDFLKGGGRGTMGAILSRKVGGGLERFTDFKQRDMKICVYIRFFAQCLPNLARSKLGQIKKNHKTSVKKRGGGNIVFPLGLRK